MYVFKCWNRQAFASVGRMVGFESLGAWGPSYRTPLLQIFLLFFPRKIGKAGKTGNISKVWKFNRGQNIWNASHSMYVCIHGNKKWKIWKYKKLRRKKCGNLGKSPSIKTVLTTSKMPVRALGVDESARESASRQKSMEIDHYWEC